MLKTRELVPELVSVCGLYCGFCPHFRKKTCPGCFKVNEKAKTSCAMYRCVLGKGLQTCLLCEEFPCETHYEKGLIFKHTFLDFIKTGDLSIVFPSGKKNP
mgnify:CR=1 FL=1